MAITRDFNGVLRLEETPEQSHVALLHHLVCESNNAGERAVRVHHLHQNLRPIFPGTTREEIVRVLLALEKDEILEAEEEGDQEVFVHTSLPGFRLEYASTAYRQAISDIYSDVERGDLFRLLDHADSTMRFVKAAGKDPSKAGKMLRRLKGEKIDDE
ncbi:hypothetical protein [Nocardiopsis sp. JB363]|uniref:hypothetical protein n=1 Tax=Nocardiopsis sp. JB363 TaxID=1434837 RepID=UPI00097B7273|nr:hypothetical protein [Nocardiopsis sp. JB363]SIO84627.1 hypothetical protein BQ8420_02865 [Nocardiopsis sp. JB363]